MGDGHELGEGGAPEESMVGARQIYHLKPDWFAAEVLGPDDDVQLDFPQRGAGWPWQYIVERRGSRAQVAFANAQLLQRGLVEEVEAAASVDEDA